MQALQPLSLTHAIGLAKIQEEKYSDIHRFQRFNNLSTTVIAPSTSTSDSTSLQPVIPKPQQHIPESALPSIVSSTDCIHTPDTPNDLKSQQDCSNPYLHQLQFERFCNGFYRQITS